MLSLCCCVGFFLVLVSGGYSLVAVRRPLIAVASLIVGHGSEACRRRYVWQVASVGVARGLICSAKGGIFPDQGSNLCLLHWQVDCPPLSYQGSPCACFERYTCMYTYTHTHTHTHTHPYILKSLANCSYKKFFLSIKPNAFHFLRICKL